ncbi:MAG: clan AA aspartic protease [Actinomycetota bacterium]|jgi:clan AA aspartic protease|nr:clan AA aspartic protease [Rubrobacter sp.]MDQ3506959.1 clan AA aspartic protease [Actinomycetota bacterium]
MMIGAVNARREAILHVEILGFDDGRIEVAAVLDTGLTGYLTLPKTEIEALGLTSQGIREAILADGRRATLEIFRTRILWDGEERGVQILASGGDPLIGMSLLHGHEINIEVKVDGAVRISPLP